jgi:hypothetical protein
MQKTPTRGAPDEAEQDDPKNVEAIERLCAKLARHKAYAEGLAEAMRRDEMRSLTP